MDAFLMRGIRSKFWKDRDRYEQINIYRLIDTHIQDLLDLDSNAHVLMN